MVVVRIGKVPQKGSRIFLKGPYRRNIGLPVSQPTRISSKANIVSDNFYTFRRF